MDNYNLRDYSDNDMLAVLGMFNHYVENSFAAYPDKKVGPEFIAWLKENAIGKSFYVLVTKGHQVVGFGVLKRHRANDVFSRTAELTYFIHPEHVRNGLGTRLLAAFLEDGKIAGLDSLLAHVSSLNEASINFHRKHGFEECGRFRRIGRKMRSDFDVVWMQRFI